MVYKVVVHKQERTGEGNVFHVASRRILAVLTAASFAVLPLEAGRAAYPEQLIKIIVTFRPAAAPIP